MANNFSLLFHFVLNHLYFRWKVVMSNKSSMSRIHLLLVLAIFCIILFFIGVESFYNIYYMIYTQCCQKFSTKKTWKIRILVIEQQLSSQLFYASDFIVCFQTWVWVNKDFHSFFAFLKNKRTRKTRDPWINKRDIAPILNWINYVIYTSD